MHGHGHEIASIITWNGWERTYAVYVYDLRQAHCMYIYQTTRMMLQRSTTCLQRNMSVNEHLDATVHRSLWVETLYFPVPDGLLPSLAWIVASKLSSRRDMSSILDSNSLLIVVNLVLSWLRRSSTTAVSSPDPSLLELTDPAAC